MNFVSTLVSFYLVSRIAKSYPAVQVPTLYPNGTNSTTWWDDDFEFNIAQSEEAPGWIYGGDYDIDEKITINDSDAEFEYHGDFYFDAAFFSFSRDFQCKSLDPASIVLSYKVRYCKVSTKSEVTITAEVNGNPLRPILTLNDIGNYDNSDPVINEICPGNKKLDKIGQKEFEAETTSLIYHRNPFTIDFQIEYNEHKDHIFIYDIKVACNTIPQQAVITEDLIIFGTEELDLYGSSGHWASYEVRDRGEPQLVYDGFVVSLSGAVKWQPLQADAPMGEINQDDYDFANGYIGKIKREEAWPKYDSIFTVTNDYGLISSIEIKGAETRSTGDGGKIYLKAWALATAFYEPEDEQFTLVSTPYDGTDASIEHDTDTTVTSVTQLDHLIQFISIGYDVDFPSKPASYSDSRDMSTISVIQFDGITYLAQGAFEEKDEFVAPVIPEPNGANYLETNIYWIAMGYGLFCAILGGSVTVFIQFCISRYCLPYAHYATLHQAKVVNYMDSETCTD